MLKHRHNVGVVIRNFRYLHAGPVRLFEFAKTHVDQQLVADQPSVDALNAVVEQYARRGFWKCFNRLRNLGHPRNHKKVWADVHADAIEPQATDKETAAGAHSGTTGYPSSTESRLVVRFYERQFVFRPAVSRAECFG